MKQNFKFFLLVLLLVAFLVDSSHDVKISSGRTSIEFTVAVVGDKNPSLVVNSGHFRGGWKTLRQGSRQFNDRKYRLLRVPKHLIGAKYFQGPCHSKGASITVSTSGTLYLLASHGNGATTKLKKFALKPSFESHKTMVMFTESFPRNDKFDQWMWRKGRSLITEITREWGPVNVGTCTGAPKHAKCTDMRTLDLDENTVVMLDCFERSKKKWTSEYGRAIYIRGLKDFSKAFVYNGSPDLSDVECAFNSDFSSSVKGSKCLWRNDAKHMYWNGPGKSYGWSLYKGNPGTLRHCDTHWDNRHSNGRIYIMDSTGKSSKMVLVEVHGMGSLVDASKKEFRCKSGHHKIRHSRAYGTNSNCEARDTCEIRVRNDCSVSVWLRDRCRSVRHRHRWSSYVQPGHSARSGSCHLKVKRPEKDSPYHQMKSTGQCKEGHQLSQSQCKSATDFGKSWGGFGHYKMPETCGCYVDQDGKRYFNTHVGKCNLPERGEKMICLRNHPDTRKGHRKQFDVHGRCRGSPQKKIKASTLEKCSRRVFMQGYQYASFNMDRNICYAFNTCNKRHKLKGGKQWATSWVNWKEVD